jgi:two-component system, NtrC family, response regulator
MASVLILDDDRNIQLLLEDLMLSMGHEFASAGSLANGLSMARNNDYDLILLDLDFPEGNGLEILPELTRLPSSPEVVIVTGTGDTKAAEIAFKYGAWDYVRKPFLLEEVSLHITRALQYRTEKTDRKTPAVLKRGNIIGESEPILACLDEVAKAAVTDSSVLITGETGTGKELFARAIHHNSNRSENNFVTIDCGALPETLAESTLFGHEKGAFTGADNRKEGLIAQAGGGTLFFDEIGELDLAVQKKLLRTLQEHRLRPVGGRKELPVDFRMVAATNRDLEKGVNDKEFREDLLFRIRGIEIKLPPLRERVEDIQPIVCNKIRKIGNHYGHGTKGISSEFVEILGKYDWPGNVRELINVLEHSIANAGSDPTLVPKHFPPAYRAALLELGHGNIPEGCGSPVTGTCFASDGQIVKWADYRFQTEKTYLQSLLSESRGNWTKACRLAGFSKSRLYELLKKHNLALSPA